MGRRDPQARAVEAVAVPAVTDVEAVPVGRREDGSPWTVRLRGPHTLVAGATGSGKGSALYSMIRGLGPAVRDGPVELWVLDPKGGMDLAPGGGLVRPVRTRLGRAHG